MCEGVQRIICCLQTLTQQFVYRGLTIPIFFSFTEFVDETNFQILEVIVSLPWTSATLE
jgi:hypothetical protein